MSNALDVGQLEMMESTPTKLVLDWSASVASGYTSLNSPARVIGNSSWYLVARGEWSARNDDGNSILCAAVFLCHLRKKGSGACTVRIRGKLGWVDNQGVYKDNGTEGPILLDYTIAHNGHSRWANFSAPYLVSHTMAYTQNSSGAIKLRAEVEYVVEAPVESKEVHPFGALVSFQESFRSLYESGISCDFVLVSSDGLEKSVHRAILIARSPVFAAMFETNLEECKTGRCVIEDVKSSVLNVLVKHMYCECKEADIDKETEDIFVAADKYQLTSLVKQCEHHLIKKLTADNIMDLLYLTDGINAPSLKSAAFNFIRANSAALKSSGAIEKLCQKASPKMIAEVLTFFLPA